MLRLLTLAVIAIIATACTRGESPKKSVVRFQFGLPEDGPRKQESLPTGYKVCFAANVVGEGISPILRTCGNPLGEFGGFVDSAGGTIELAVPAGPSRDVDLYAYLSADTSAACPTLDASCAPAVACQTYKVATAKGVDMTQEETAIDMVVNFPGMQNNAVIIEVPTSTLCANVTPLPSPSPSPSASPSPDPSVSPTPPQNPNPMPNPTATPTPTPTPTPPPATPFAALTIDGRILDIGFSPLAGVPLTPVSFTFYKRSAQSPFEIVTRSGLATENQSFLVRPQLRSLALRPNTNELYGLLSDGTVVSVDSFGGYSPITICPFATCALPKWFKSFAIGDGTDIYGLDHAGGFWRMSDPQTPILISSYPPYILQILMQ